MPRLSGAEDLLPITLSERLMDGDNLPVSAFVYGNFHIAPSGVCLYNLGFCRERFPVVKKYAAAQNVKRLIVRKAFYVSYVRFVYVSARMRYAVCKIAVVCHNKQSACVKVKSAYGENARV